MMQSEQMNELASALAKSQGEMGAAAKDSTNPFFKSKYADLHSVWEACRGPLSKNGLSVIQTTDEDEKGIFIVTTLLHSSGQWIRGNLPIKAIKQDPQGIGSAITYARRYALMAIVGIVPTEENDGKDDDGNGASNRQTSAPAGKSISATKVTSVSKEKQIVTPNQIARLFAIQSKSDWSREDMRAFMYFKFKVDSTKKLNMRDYESLIDAIESGSPPEDMPAPPEHGPEAA